MRISDGVQTCALPISLWFLAVNRNKKSMALDYREDAGKAVLHALVDTADVVILNQTADLQKKLGLDAATLRAARPRLIHASITRSEARRVGKECVSTCRSRWSPYHSKQKHKKNEQ